MTADETEWRIAIEEFIDSGKLAAVAGRQHQVLVHRLVATYYRLSKLVGPAKAPIVMECIQEIPQLAPPTRVRGKGKADPKKTTEAVVKRLGRERQQRKARRAKIVEQIEEIVRLADKR
jgi:hypothetical protein